ncbi:MAG TPA: protein kinase [Terriglobales bacterium]|nr:protein kinase [Terriglobales bacterium]
MERIGAGGMGEVYRARDERLERDVAIKILSTESIGDLEAGKRLRREAQSASALNDPHICTIYEVGEANGRAFIVMELVEGRALNSLIPPEGLQFWALWQVLSELYRTMALVAVLSGMRSGEIFGLRWRYVDFEERSILVAETVYRGRSSMPKTGFQSQSFHTGLGFGSSQTLEVIRRRTRRFCVLYVQGHAFQSE